MRPNGTSVNLLLALSLLKQMQCAECKARYLRTCHVCHGDFCLLDNEGSSATEVPDEACAMSCSKADSASATGVSAVAAVRERCISVTRATTATTATTRHP